MLYVDLGEFARHLVELYSSGRVGEFARVFDVIESLHVHGDSYVREAATVGLLEGIQNIASHSSVDAEVFVKYLQPESLRWWNKLKDFWSKGKLLTDD